MRLIVGKNLLDFEEAFRAHTALVHEMCCFEDDDTRKRSRQLLVSFGFDKRKLALEPVQTLFGLEKRICFANLERFRNALLDGSPSTMELGDVAKREVWIEFNFDAHKKCGAGGGIRTLETLRSGDFKSPTYTSSVTPA